MAGGRGPGPMGIRLDESITRQQVKPGTLRRIAPFAWRHRWTLALLLTATAIDSVIMVANPLLLRMAIDNGILPRKTKVVVAVALTAGVLAVIDAVAVYFSTWTSARVGQGLVYDLRTEVFRHVRQQPLAFFTRSQTGSLVSRLSTDVVGAQAAVTSLLSQTVSMLLTLTLVIAAMFFLSWQVSIAALVVIPGFIIPGRLIGQRMQRLTREGMQLDAELGSLMNERFNVAGAMLVKLYGRPEEESRLFATRAAKLRDIFVVTNVYGRIYFILMTLLAALITAALYGEGGTLVVRHTLQLGTLVALVALVGRLYGPINQLASLQVDVRTALVSFDRLFEVLDLKPAITERSAAIALASGTPESGAAPGVEFHEVCFRYPSAKEVTLSSLELVTRLEPERANDALVLRDVCFQAPAGKLTALVGPSGAGKTTITHLVPRLYDPLSGCVRIDGQDLRDLTLQSINDTIGVVPQEAHLFHDTIRANLLYARPGASERELIEACQAARIWDLISSLPEGLDTIAGDRGYRFSGGEKQRIALARLLVKAPTVVVLDEATAHLDSESEVAIQRALKTALSGRTSLVIAHRLSTIREADQILVIDNGRVRERGTHDELIGTGGLYAELYRTQFARQPVSSTET
jgi:ATP-binding cassette subfamily B protein